MALACMSLNGSVLTIHGFDAKRKRKKYAALKLKRKQRKRKNSIGKRDLNIMRLYLSNLRYNS